LGVSPSREFLIRDGNLNVFFLLVLTVLNNGCRSLWCFILAWASSIGLIVSLIEATATTSAASSTTVIASVIVILVVRVALLIATLVSTVIIVATLVAVATLILIGEAH
jgi:hypothetical protein